MGRHKKVQEGVQAPKAEQTTPAIVEDEPVAPVVAEPIVDEVKPKVVDEKLALEKRIKELEVKLQESRALDDVDELAKSPTFGTKMYLHLQMENLVNPKNPNMRDPIVAMISVFPNAADPSELDPATKKPRMLCPDIGVSREVGDRIRETNADFFELGIGFDGNPRRINLLTEYNGKTMRVKEVIRLMRLDYLKRRREGDELHKTEMDNIKRASE